MLVRRRKANGAGSETLMAFIVHILAKDLEGWELENQTAGYYHYRPRLEGEVREQIQILSPMPLERLLDRDMFCLVTIERGWMSKKVGSHPEVKFKLKNPEEPLRDSRRLRLKIESIDTATRPPRVILEAWTGTS